MVEVGLVVLLSVGLPMSLVAVIATIGFRKNKAGAQGIAATAKVPGEPSRSSQKYINGKNKELWLLLSVKKRNRLN